jgi:phosphatidylserine decarboxylase
MEILKVLPKNLLSQAVGELAQIEKPEALAITARDWFIKRYKINVEEAELPLDHYPSIAKLFTRKLKAGVRPIGTGIVHPCDAALNCAEVISADSLIQAKGRTYSLAQFLLQPRALETYRGGTHLVYYLCPTDYHRVHSPVDGHIVSVKHVPGHLWPVNNWSVNAIENLFAVNERVIVNIQTVQGPVALVMVGATNVGKITMSFDRGITTNSKNKNSKVKEKKYPSPIPIKRGDEVGVFNMGSTVIMIYPPGMIAKLPEVHKVKMGESL